METINSTRRRKLYAILLWTLLFLFLLAYNRSTISNMIDPQPPIVQNSPNRIRALNMWNRLQIDSCLNEVQDGDLVVRAGADPLSLLFIKANSQEKRFSHAGVVFIENGYPMVYNSIATAEEPHAKVSRDSLNSFVDPYSTTAFSVYRYALSRRQIQKLQDVLKGYYREERRFDPHFDLETDSLLYCSEIVYKAVIEATGQKNYFSTTRAGAFEFVSIDNLYLKKGIRPICQVIYK